MNIAGVGAAGDRSAVALSTEALIQEHDPWEKHAGWWQDGFTEGADPEYVEQILPLTLEYLTGYSRILDIGTGEGQSARALQALGCEVVGLDPTFAQVVAAVERGGGPVYGRGAAECLPLRDESFDAVLACLVFEHIPDCVPAIREVARVLKPGGRFVFFLNHPLLQCPGSGWIIDHILDEEYWRVGPYLTADVVMEELSPGVLLPFVHRPMNEYVNTMADAGLQLRRMLEPAPPQGFIDKAPEYQDAATIPRLLVLIAEKA